MAGSTGWDSPLRGQPANISKKSRRVRGDVEADAVALRNCVVMRGGAFFPTLLLQRLFAYPFLFFLSLRL